MGLSCLAPQQDAIAHTGVNEAVAHAATNARPFQMTVIRPT
jgi:hypothetical protein